MVVTWRGLVTAIEQDPELKGAFTGPPVRDEKMEKAEIERLFQFIGAYVVAFQDVESKLDQIIQLAIGLDRPHVSHCVIRTLSNSQKTDLIQSVVHSSEVADGSPSQRAWLASFDEVLKRLRAEASRRNKIVHSMYIFDFMEIGCAPLRSKRTRKVGELSFDQEQVDASYINEATTEVVELSFDAGMLLVQLRHWDEKLRRSSHQVSAAD
ncbi:hypothetical protein ACQR1Y_18290 [Bradyrhizobium sp. HKCCYLRH3099]|uniref:hypothetical protein n=1 Tax=unclassified Bradyrhizobium TaxID=2631580 RepID=UPI003EC054B8